MMLAIALLPLTFVSPPSAFRSTQHALRASQPPRAEAFFSGTGLDDEALRIALESQEKAAAEAARRAADEAWKQIEDALPALAPTPPPVLTLYRDTNGWCPFCERVWLQLHAKKIPFREELIDLRDKPEWYKEMVPTTLVPAIKYDDDGAVVWESKDIMLSLEERFSSSAESAADGPHPAMLPPEGTAARVRVEALMESCGDLLGAGVRMSYPNASATDEEIAEAAATFEGELGKLDAAIAEGGGPFLGGDAFSLADCMYIPMMERWAAQLPLTTGLALRERGGGEGAARWPAIAGWLDAMEDPQLLPAYSEHVMGDRYSWVCLIGTFQRMFSSSNASATDPARAAKAKEAIRKSDAEARVILHQLKLTPLDEHRAEHRAAAARAVFSNRAAIVADALLQEPKTQVELRRMEPEDGPLVETVLREACRRLLEIELGWDADDSYTDQPGDAALAAIAAKYVASRACVPRDLGAPAAAALRTTLLQMADEAETYAWKASGGLL